MPKAALFRMVSRLALHPWFRLTRGTTLGVRAVVIDGKGRVLLVQHSYAPGWILPGGGVERGETAYDAVRRELHEEAGIVIVGEPVLHGLFANHEQFKGDHLACFLVRRYREEPFAPSREIAAARFFAPAEFPARTTGGTRRRVAEILDGTPVTPDW
ncbi:MAG: NUDIX domain-containing protein [Rhizobiales bacterium]|nr:NUDIX domain-containing protein [Hyphomicrobiales bacterium]